MSIDTATRARIDDLVTSNEVVLFMKGTRDAPQCGFSATVVGILDGLISEYSTLDVLTDPSLREGIKAYSEWPTVPQLYVRGEFVGGCDIIQELAGSGELIQALKIEEPALDRAPNIQLTAEAVEGLRSAATSAPPESELHLGIDARFQNKLFFAPIGPGEVRVDAGGIAIFLDPYSASRADGLTIDVVDSSEGQGFRIDNPNTTAGQVRQLSVQDLKHRLDAGEVGEFFDVRTPEERARASISGTRLMTPEEAERIASLPRETTLIFHCHHGGRSQAAAEHFAGMGFERVFNVAGGIDAWSQEIDHEVPRY